VLRGAARRACWAAILGVAGFDFDIDIHLGAGAYVCGEESALIESLEGKRGTPRIRPPFPVERGYLGRPTVVNNVETFCAVAHIARHGGAWWAGIGTPQSTGTKIHSVSGDCERPGLYEYPLRHAHRADPGTAAPRDTQAVQVGGPSGLCLPAFEFGRAHRLRGRAHAGAFMVFDRSRDMFEVARGFAHFFAHESCGFCTPCRVGTELVVRAGQAGARARPRARATTSNALHELDEAAAQRHPLRPGCHGLQPAARHAAQFRPAYERAPPRRSSSPDSTSTPSCRRRAA
jgi:[NiFe] hydrogenase diaphorase moiety large subunit